MNKWKWEIEDDYAGPAPGAWIWLGLALGAWIAIFWLIFHSRH